MENAEVKKRMGEPVVVKLQTESWMVVLGVCIGGAGLAVVGDGMSGMIDIWVDVRGWVWT